VTRLLVIRFLAIMLVCCSSVPTRAAQLVDPRVQQWISKASTALDPRAVDTLARVDGPDRQLLALRAYLRAGESLPARWSWTLQQLSDYPNTDEGIAAGADIGAVEATFAAANPGFNARANRMPRSLEVQLDHWNHNASVAAVAAQLVAALELQFPNGSVSADAAQLRQALIGWQPGSAAPLAAPGLSAHGQGRAFDFQIEQDGRIVAGLEASTARQQWDAKGWTRKLRAAVIASGKPFSGPLQSPYEPWHYAYTPSQADFIRSRM
jgi:hypothetical protein